MNDHIDPIAFGLDDRFAIGQPVPRSEDPVLLRGEGRYSDDVSLPGQAYAMMVRSHHAHGVIRGIDMAAARAMPGVLAVYTAADLAASGIGPLPPRQVGLALPLPYTVYERPTYSVVPSNALWRDPARADVAEILRKNEEDNRRRDDRLGSKPPGSRTGLRQVRLDHAPLYVG
jgi:hypothetical protein